MFFSVFFLVLGATACLAQQTEGYKNPVIPGFHPDPSVCKVGDDYYLATSSFEYFPGIPIFHSNDLINWKQIGFCLTRKSQVDLKNTAIWSGIWAPTLRYNNGTFYMITTNVTNGGNFYVTATNPAGPWSEPIFVDKPMFDPSLFFDEDGKVYYTRRGKEGIVQAEIDINTGKLLDTLKTISYGFLSKDTEGPHLYKIGEYYYLLTAEGGTRALHMVNIGRSKSPWGPFEKNPNNPILAQHHTYGEIKSTGHGDLIEAADGSWWMVFLATRHYNYDAMSHLGRETFLAPIKWENGWPVVSANVTEQLQVNANTLPQTPKIILPLKDDFDTPKLGFQYNYLRNPDSAFYSLTRKKGSLSLLGNKATLSEIQSPTFVGRRQADINFVVETKIGFKPEKPNEESGLTTFMNAQQHYDFFISKRKDKKVIVLRKTIGDISVETDVKTLEADVVMLKVWANKDLYTFQYSINGKDFITVGTAIPQLLGPEITSSFTGVYIAMYSTGNGKINTNWANFDYFNYQKN